MANPCFLVWVLIIQNDIICPEKLLFAVDLLRDARKCRIIDSEFDLAVRYGDQSNSEWSSNEEHRPSGRSAGEVSFHMRFILKSIDCVLRSIFSHSCSMFHFGRFVRLQSPVRSSNLSYVMSLG